MRHPAFCLTAFLALFPGLLAEPVFAEPSVTSPDDSQSLKVTKRVNAIYPAALSREGVVEGEAVVICSIDAEGRMTDQMPLAYSHEGFYTAARTAILQWEFEPARYLGRPHPVVQTYTFRFRAGRDVVDINAHDYMLMFIHSPGGTGDHYRVATLAELDAIPTPIELTRPLYPEVHVGSGIEGDVVVEFYIDETGAVRFPAIVEQTSADFAAVAVEAVRQWRFEPPMRDGEPVAVMVRQEFHFNASDGDG